MEPENRLVARKLERRWEQCIREQQVIKEEYARFREQQPVRSCRAGLGDAPRTLIQELAKIKSGDIVLPTVGRDGRPGKTVRVRYVTTPDKAQRVLLSRLGLTLPQRLKYMEDALQM